MTTDQELLPAIDSQHTFMDMEGFGRLSMYVDASAGGVPLLLVHSVNAAPSAMEMRPIFDAMRGERSVYALELPGFGRSDRPDIEYTTTVFRSAIACAIKNIGAPEIDLVGLSLSCEFSAFVASEPNSGVRSLTLISPTGLSWRKPPAMIGDGIFSVSRLPMVAKSLYKALTSRPSIRYFLGQAFHRAPPSELVDYAYETSHQPGARFAPYYFLSFGLFNDNAVEHLYKALSVPTLIVYDRDPNVAFDRLGELVSNNTHVKAVRIERTLGLPHWECHERTMRVMATFWETLP